MMVDLQQVIDAMVDRQLEQKAESARLDRELKRAFDEIAQLRRAIKNSPPPAEDMDDFIRAVLADNNPRTDEPYATVAKWIRKLRRSPTLPPHDARGTP